MFTLNPNPILNNEKKWEGWRDGCGWRWEVVSFCSVLPLIHELLCIGCVRLLFFLLSSFSHFKWMRWLFIGIVWLLVVTVQSVLSFCSRFCGDSGFIFPLSGGYSSIELVLRSVIFVICGLLRMRIILSSRSFWLCLLFGIIVHCCSVIECIWQEI